MGDASSSDHDIHAADAPPRRAERFVGWIAGLLAALPVLVWPYPPMTDLPRHEAIVALLRTWGDPERAPPGLYVLNLGHPRQLFHLLALPFSYVVSVTLACKIVVALTMVAIPVAAARLARHRGSSPWIAPALVPMALGWQFSRGYVNDLLGLAALLAFLPSLDAFVNSPSGRRLRPVLAGLVVLYLAHEVMLFVYVAAAFAFALLEPVDDRKTAALRAVPPIAGVLLGALALLLEREAVMPPTTNAVLSVRLRELPETLVGASDRGSVWIVFGSCLFVLAMFALEGRRQRAAARGAEGDVAVTDQPRATGYVERLQHMFRPYRFELLGALCFVLFIGGPASLDGIAMLNQRFLAPAYALAAIGAGASCTNPRGLVRMLAAILPLEALLIGWPAFVDASRSIEALDRLLARIPRQSAVVSVDLGGAYSRPYDPAPAPNRMLVTRGGRVLSPWAEGPSMPVTVAAPFRWAEISARMTRDELALRPRHDLSRFSYVIVHSGSTQDVHLAAAALLPDARFVDTAGEWALFKSTHAVAPLDAPELPLPAPPPATLRARIQAVLAADGAMPNVPSQTPL